jgi:hypothetical protein
VNLRTTGSPHAWPRVVSTFGREADTTPLKLPCPLMTHSGHSLQSIDASRNDYSITSSARAVLRVNLVHRQQGNWMNVWLPVLVSWRSWQLENGKWDWYREWWRS